MRKIIVAMLVLFGLSLGQAAAQCSGTQLDKAALDAFAGKTVCGRPGAGYPGAATDRWQEEHFAPTGMSTIGDLFDYKLGPSSTMDPREKVGTWTTTDGGMMAADTITHSYNGGGSYTYTVFLNSGVHSFCSGTSEIVRATLQNGTGAACAGYPAASGAFGSRTR